MQLTLAYSFLILLKLLLFAAHFNRIRSCLTLCLFSFHFVSLGILICLSKHFLPQIFISYQSSLFNLKSEHGALNCITCMARITPALIGALRRDARSILLTHARMRSLHSALLEEENGELATMRSPCCDWCPAFQKRWANCQSSHCDLLNNIWLTFSVSKRVLFGGFVGSWFAVQNISLQLELSGGLDLL